MFYLFSSPETMTEKWVKFERGNPIVVSMIGCAHISHFLEACKRKLSPLFDSIPLDLLSLSTSDYTFKSYDAILEWNTGEIA
jgi:hypothetical protein